ncbi:MAG: hypothetical protein ABSF85_06370 [Terriglobales bacterium]|jgi:DNA-binding MarR family transcriptional regulator
MVAYASNPDHRWAKLVYLTERGKKAVQELERHHAAWANQMASCVRHPEMKLAL